jgi:hypothetical protein
MLALRPYVDVPSTEILVAEPWHGANECFPIPDTRKHDRFAISSFGFEESDLEDVGTHRRDLQFDRASCAIADRSCSHVQCP